MAIKMKKAFIGVAIVILLGLVGFYFLFPQATFDLLRTNVFATYFIYLFMNVPQNGHKTDGSSDCIRHKTAR